MGHDNSSTNREKLTGTKKQRFVLYGKWCHRAPRSSRPHCRGLSELRYCRNAWGVCSSRTSSGRRIYSPQWLASSSLFSCYSPFLSTSAASSPTSSSPPRKEKTEPQTTTVISADAPVNLQKMNQPRKQKPEKNSGFSIENRKKGVLWLVTRGGEVHGVIFFMGSRGCGGKLNVMMNQEWWRSIIMSQFGWTSLFPGRGL